MSLGIFSFNNNSTTMGRLLQRRLPMHRGNSLLVVTHGAVAGKSPKKMCD
jgi:hypothetical protein